MNKSDEKRYTQDQVDLALMATDLRQVKDTVESMSKKLDANYVTKEELRTVILQLEMVQKIVYGVVGLILTAFVGGVVTLIIK